MKLGWRLRNRLQRVRGTFAERRFESNLRLLHDTLEATQLAGRYWLVGGLLLGWARERRVLPHDYDDADFAYLERDRSRVVAATDALSRAGFTPHRRWRSSEGDICEYTFRKDGARFEFFEMKEREGAFHYYLIAPHRNPKLELHCVVPRHGLEGVDFLGRRWLRPDHVDEYLTAVYGTWRVPDPAYDYVTDEKSVVARRIWTGRSRWVRRRAS